MSPHRPAARPRARVELAARLVDLSEYTAALADVLLSDDAAFSGGELTPAARRVRLASLGVLVAALRHERADGRPWEFLARALGDHRGPDGVAAHYRATVTAWLDAADADRAAVPVLPGLGAGGATWATRIPRDWRAARTWLTGWRTRRALAAAP